MEGRPKATNQDRMYYEKFNPSLHLPITSDGSVRGTFEAFYCLTIDKNENEEEWERIVVELPPPKISFDESTVDDTIYWRTIKYTIKQDVYEWLCKNVELYEGGPAITMKQSAETRIPIYFKREKDVFAFFMHFGQSKTNLTQKEKAKYWTCSLGKEAI